MESEEQVHSHYWPGNECLDISPQAAQFGYVFPVFVAKSVWSSTITWNMQQRQTSASSRIYELLRSCYSGLSKALAVSDDMVFFRFEHWYWDRHRPKAKKQTKARLGARLLLYPESEEPWLLIFDPAQDNEEILEHGEPTKNTGNDGLPGEVGLGVSPDLDDGNSADTGKNDDPHIGAVEGS